MNLRMSGGVGVRIWQEFLAGLSSLTLILPLAGTAGAIVYSPLAGDAASGGVLAGILCAGLGGLAASLIRGNSGIVMSPVASYASLQASGLAVLMPVLGTRSELLPGALLALLVLTGLLEIGLGLSGAGRLAKFVPFAVVSGFKSGLGIHLILTFVPALLGAESLRSLWESASDPHALNPVLASFSIALLVLAFVARRLLRDRLPAIPLIFMIGIVAYHGLRLAGHGGPLGPTLMADGGWSLLGDALQAAPRLAYDGATVMTKGSAAGALLVSAATLALFALLDTVFATRAAQSIGEGPAEPRRDMIGLGFGTMVGAVFGGIGLSTSLTLTVSNYQAGGRTRLSTITAAIALLAVVLILPQALSIVPLSLLPTLITFVGWSMLDPYTSEVLRRAVFEARDEARDHTRRDALIHLSVLAPTALNQPIVGVAVGIALSCLLFIRSMSRPIVRRVRDGRDIASKRVRTRSDAETLAARRDAFAVLDLEGPLFFGNAEDLAIKIRSRSHVRFVILNLEGVTDIDGTGANIIGDTRRRLAASGKILMLAETPVEIGAVLNRFFPAEHRYEDLDDALEFAENAVAGETAPDDRCAGQGARPGPIDLRDFDLCEGASSDQLEFLMSLLREETVPTGAELCREGEPASCLWMIRAGAVSVRLRSGRSDRRLAAYGAGTIIGEMAVIENKPRSASVVVDATAELYVLDLAAYQNIITNHPDLAALIFKNISLHLSERLRRRTNDLKLAIR